VKAIILSGGLGTRLRPLTCTTPKALLPLLNRPFIEYQFALLDKCHIREVIFCLNYKPQPFRKYFKKLHITDRRLKIDYIVEKEPLGTGGAVKNAFLRKKIKEPVIIFNGDVLTDIDLKKIISFHEKNKAKVTIALYRVDDPTLYGLVETDKVGRIKRFLEKPSLDEITTDTINAGIYIFEPEVFDYIPFKVSSTLSSTLMVQTEGNSQGEPSGINYSLERGLFPLLLENNLPLYGYIHQGYWLDIGTVKKYLQANFDLMNQKVKGVRLKVKSMKEKEKLVLGENTKISDSIQVLGNVCIGKNCFVGENVILKDSVILDHTYIGEGAKLENCAIGNKCKIEPYAVLGPGTALGDGSVIKKYSRV